ncbi:MAG TPA: nucleotidyltransferase domain-containing protein [Puia sp.]|nr:nucleotidyltransferase domain-containing protein [Puia sp.]
MVKKAVHLFDSSASVILFGSRARGDAKDESDWDFLILTKKKDTDLLMRSLIPVIRERIELVYAIAISLIIKNKMVWKENYAVTNIYGSIMKDGINL